MNESDSIPAESAPMNAFEQKVCDAVIPLVPDCAYLQREIERLETLLLTRTNFDNWSVSTVNAGERARTESELRFVAHRQNGTE